MHASTGILSLLLTSLYLGTNLVYAAQSANSTNQWSPPTAQRSSPSITPTLDPSLPPTGTPTSQPMSLSAPDDTFDPPSSSHPPGTTTSQSWSMSTPDDIFEPQSILHPLQVTPTTLQPTQNPPPTRTPAFTPPPAQTPFSNPPSPPAPSPSQSHYILPNPNLTPFDTTQCQSQKHCLLCADPTTTLTCYKFACQCQRGTPSSHYMPASLQSCHQADLCLSCPRGSSPWTWGRMAVCLTIWKHEAVEGEGNPLTNWSERGVKGMVVGRGEMSEGDRPGSRVVMVGVGMLVVWGMGFV